MAAIRATLALLLCSSIFHVVFTDLYDDYGEKLLEVKNCSTFCSKYDKDLSCWNKTMQYHERVLLGGLRAYVAVQQNQKEWRRQNGHMTYDLEVAGNDTVDNWMDDVMEQETRELVFRIDMDRVVQALMVDVNQTLTVDQNVNYPRNVSCPTPCERPYEVWRYLFYGSMGLNLAIAIAVLPFIYLRSRRDHNMSSSEPLIK